jgi:phosphoglycerate dehydrogenase-like enzyme
LDVYENEPLPGNHPLRQLPNVLLTPRVASATAEANRRMDVQAFNNIVAALDGNRPSNPVNDVRETQSRC